MSDTSTLAAAGRSAKARDAALLVLVASLAFATSSPLARLARPAHPLFIAFGRVLLASALLWLTDPRGLARSFGALTIRERLLTAAAGGLLGAHFALFQWGLDQTSLAAAVSLVSLEPLGVVLSAWALFGIRPRPLERIGVLFATAGAVVVGRGAGQGEHRALGDALVLGSVVLYGLYVSIARGLRDALPAKHYAPLVYAFAAAGLLLALPCVASSDAARVWPQTRASLGYIALLALIPTVVGHTLVQTGARFLSPSIVALVSPGETLGSIAIAAVLFGTAPSATEAAGGVVILAGAAVALLAQRSRALAPS